MSDYTFSPLTPTAFLDRSAYVFRDRLAIVDGDLRFTYAEFGHRSRQLAGGLIGSGVEPGSRVAALCANSHVMLELHNGAPYSGAVLVPLNIRLTEDELIGILKHADPSLLVVTQEFAEKGKAVARATGIQLILDDGPGGDYETLLERSEPQVLPVSDERQLLAISYTSGTTNAPKGVMYHHRGAYLQSLAVALHAGLRPTSRYLWTLPQFHCDGWCFTWAVTAVGATHVCLRTFDAEEVWRLIRDEEITHFSGAPTVLTMLAEAVPPSAPQLERTVQVSTGGAPPSPSLLNRMAALNVDVTHLFGLTETFGPIAINDWHPEWSALPDEEQARLKARQGVGNVVAERLRVVDTNGTDVPADGETVGEIVCRGNTVMLGYYQNDRATSEAALGDWLRTGDLGVVYPDGYVEIRDRSKDLIISGGENIASVEVERVLDSHPAISESAVVARPSERWGEVPVAFVTLRVGADATSDEIISFVRARLAHFKAPKEIYFVELPKTSTGKIQKNVLRRLVQTSASHRPTMSGEEPQYAR